jgi:phosphatidylglycerophosphate synthase
MKETITELRIICQHSLSTWSEQPWIFLQIRKISVYLTWLLLHTKLTPNSISVISLFTAILATFFTGVGLLITGFILIQITIVLDFSDGEVSRYRNLRSKEGSYLDKIYVFLVHPILFVGITIYEFRVSNNIAIVIAGFINVISIFLYCMAVEYCKLLVVWRHLIAKITAEKTFFWENQQSYVCKEIVFRGPKSIIKSFFKDLLKLWDFPYIFIIMSIAIIFEVLLTKNSFVNWSPISIYLYFYAFTFPIIIAIVIIKNVFFKVIQRDYDELVKKIIKNGY